MNSNGFELEPPHPRVGARPNAAFLIGGAFLSLLPPSVCLAREPPKEAVEAADDCPTAVVDKWRYSLFNPTPDQLMREMSTDRPDATESPYTVPAGHFQFELSLGEYTYNDDDGVRTNTLAVLPTNFKVGLLNNVDLQLILSPYVRAETEARGEEETAEGFGDTQLRLKINLWGNDCPQPGFGSTAFGFMPFINFSTGEDELSNNHIEGGLIFPLAVALPAEFSLGLMAEVDFVYNDEADDYGVNLVHSASIGHAIVESVAAYIEYVGVAPHDTGPTYQAIGSTGLTHALSDDWIIDTGLTFGISDSADDFSPFVGTSFRY